MRIALATLQTPDSEWIRFDCPHPSDHTRGLIIETAVEDGGEGKTVYLHTGEYFEGVVDLLGGESVKLAKAMFERARGQTRAAIENYGNSGLHVISLEGTGVIPKRPVGADYAVEFSLEQNRETPSIFRQALQLVRYPHITTLRRLPEDAPTYGEIAYGAPVTAALSPQDIQSLVERGEVRLTEEGMSDMRKGVEAPVDLHHRTLRLMR